MISHDAATQAALNRRVSINADGLFWIECADRTTGARKGFGFWTGDDHQTFTIRGVDRLYYGAGTIQSMDPIIYTTGLVVQTQRLTLSLAAPEVITAVRTYDTRLAPVEIHRALWDVDTGLAVSEPEEKFTGSCDGDPITRDKIGGHMVAQLSLVSAARAGTRNLATTWSQAALEEISPGDLLFQYATAPISTTTLWGGK